MASHVIKNWLMSIFSLFWFSITTLSNRPAYTKAILPIIAFAASSTVIILMTSQNRPCILNTNWFPVLLLHSNLMKILLHLWVTFGSWFLFPFLCIHFIFIFRQPLPQWMHPMYWTQKDCRLEVTHAFWKAGKKRELCCATHQLGNRQLGDKISS